MSDSSPLRGEDLGVRYDARLPLVIDGVTIEIPAKRVTALIGANGSGKSTLLKALARQLVPEAGRVILNGRDISTQPLREIAKNLGILFQEHTAPEDLTVERLAYYGRFPHRSLFDSMTAEDHDAVNEALRMAGLDCLRNVPVRRLSGGQRQLAWIAMALAQSSSWLLLDEPTTFLDLAHQFDVMDLIGRLNRELGKSVLMVVHDINLAARYADYLFALREGRIVAAGSPSAVLTPEVLRDVFGVEATFTRDASQQFLVCIPLRRSPGGNPA